MSTLTSPTWKYLSQLLVCFEGECVIVELKNGLEVTGILDSVDVRDMSVLLGKAKQRWIEGKKQGCVGPDMELVFFSGSRIRYIHFPSTFNMDNQLRAWHNRKQKATFRRNYIVDRKKKSVGHDELDD